QVLASLFLCRDTFRPPARLDRQTENRVPLAETLQVISAGHFACVPGAYSRNPDAKPSSAIAQDGRGFFFSTGFGLRPKPPSPHPGAARGGWSTGGSLVARRPASERERCRAPLTGNFWVFHADQGVRHFSGITAAEAPQRSREECR